MTTGAANFIAVCIGILTFEMTLVLGAMIYLALRLARTARTVESLVYTVEDKVAAFKTGWVRVFQGAAGLFTGYMGARRHSRAGDGVAAGR